MRYAALILLVAVSAGSAHAEEAAPYHDANAIVVNLTERDLNLALQDLWHTVGSRFEGTKKEASSVGLGLRYDGRFSTPTIDLRKGGQATTAFIEHHYHP